MLNDLLVLHQKLGDIWGPGKLDKVKHAPLVNELTRFSAEAGISPRDVSGQDYYLTDFEIEYLSQFHAAKGNGVSGMIYTGVHEPPVSARMRSSCGAMLRNYMSCRYILRDELIRELWDEKNFPIGDLICVPDLTFVDMPEGVRRAVASWLQRRIVRGHQTAIGVDSKKALRLLLGSDTEFLLPKFHVANGSAVPNS